MTVVHTLPHTATHGIILQHTAKRRKTPQHTATRCNTGSIAAHDFATYCLKKQERTDWNGYISVPRMPQKL